jgi:8-oxo-dGTP diphosphatase
MKYDTATPYTACFVLLRKDGKVAFVLRSQTAWMNGHYGLPSGKVENDESYTAGAVREVKEEIGVDLAQSDLAHVLTMHRGPHHQDEPDGTTWVDVYFEATSWQGEPFNAEPNKHSELAWLDPDNLPKNVVPPVAAAIHAIQAGKTYAEYGWN